jgi:hypothetical protein
MYFGFLYKFIWNFSNSKKNWARYYKNVYWSARTVAFSLADLCETWIFSKNGEKDEKIKFHETPTVGAELFCDEANSRFSQFANAPKKWMRYVRLVYCYSEPMWLSWLSLSSAPTRVAHSHHALYLPH